MPIIERVAFKRGPTVLLKLYFTSIMGLISPALTNQISVFATSMNKLFILLCTPSPRQLQLREGVGTYISDSNKRRRRAREYKPLMST